MSTAAGNTSGQTKKNSNSNSNSNSNENNNEAANTFVFKPFTIANMPTAMPRFPMLAPTPSGVNYEEEAREQNRRRKEQTKRNKLYGKKVPFTDTLMVDIVKKLTPCPRGEFATRVFRQHTNMGLCWHDSFYMMVFENDFFKGKSLELLQEFFHVLNLNNIGTLDFDSRKTQAIANGLKAYRKSELDIGTWEMTTLALQRYALLGLLFVKESQEEQLTKPVVKSRLLNRRPSVGELNFNSVHNLLKRGTMRCFDEGASRIGIYYFMLMMADLVDELSEKKFKLDIATNPLQPSETIAYYFSVQTHETLEDPHGFVGNAHIMSFFICGGEWYLYDNETGVLPLGAEHSAAIATYGIDSMKILTEGDMFLYPITLGNGTIIRVEMPHVETVHLYEKPKGPGTHVLRGKTLNSSSYRIVSIKGDEEEKAVVTAAGETKNGGRRRRL